MEKFYKILLKKIVLSLGVFRSYSFRFKSISPKSVVS